MINLQLYVEIMRLGAEGRGREEQDDFSQSKFWVGRSVARRWESPGDHLGGTLAKPGRAGASGAWGQPGWGWGGFNELPQFLPTRGLLDGMGQ